MFAALTLAIVRINKKIGLQSKQYKLLENTKKIFRFFEF